MNVRFILLSLLLTNACLIQVQAMPSLTPNSINVDACIAYAASVAEAMNEEPDDGLEAPDLDVCMLFDDPVPQCQKTPEELQREKDNRARQKEREKKLYDSRIANEELLLKRVKDFLDEDVYENIKASFDERRLIPSKSLLSIAKNFPKNEKKNPKAFSRDLNLLLTLEDYSDYTLIQYNGGAPVTAARTKLFHYYIDLYNRYTNQNRFKSHSDMHQLIQRCQRSVPYEHPGFDDFEFALYYIYKEVNDRLFQFRTYALNHPRLPSSISLLKTPHEQALKVMEMGAQLLNMQTYGVHPRITDLEFFLRKTGFKLYVLPHRNSHLQQLGLTQHVYVSKCFPLQVRMAELSDRSGKLTVSILSHIPFDANGVVTKGFLFHGEQLKVSTYVKPDLIIGGVTFRNKLLELIPSRYNSPHLSPSVRCYEQNFLMDSAHRYFTCNAVRFSDARRRGIKGDFTKNPKVVVLKK